jgi:hypothetical protein
MLGALGGLGCALLLSASAPLPQAQTSKAAIPEIILTVNPAQSTVHWSVDSSLHLVHGTFALKSGALHFESGNASRDARMHKEILESTKYPDLIFQPTQIDGHIAVSGASDAKLHGVFSIHGADHDLIAAVHAELTGNHWKGTTQFEVPYVRWGIKDPSNFLLKVKHVVSVELELSGEVKAPK